MNCPHGYDFFRCVHCRDAQHLLPQEAPDGYQRGWADAIEAAAKECEAGRLAQNGPAPDVEPHVRAWLTGAGWTSGLLTAADRIRKLKPEGQR